VAGDPAGGPAGRAKEPSRIGGWLDGLASALGEQPMSPSEVAQVLKLSRDVAHGVERMLAPLAAFAAGVHVGQRTGEGGSREEALAEAIRAAASLLPEQPSDESPSSPQTG
jgi:hypothetical protein